MRRQRTRGPNVKQPIKARKKYLVIRIFLVIFLVTNLASFMVWQNIKGMELDRQIRELERIQLSLHNAYYEKALQYEIVRHSPSVISFAKEHMAMIPTRRSDFISLGVRDKRIMIQKYQGGTRVREK